MGPALSAPLKVGDKVIGEINVNAAAFREIFGEEDEAVLKSAADMAVVAMKSTHLEGQIKALDSVRADFISSFPHELRIPLTVIKDAVGMMLDGTTGEINDIQKKCLQLAVDNIGRLWRLTEELLELSKQVEAKSPMKRELFDIVRAVSEVMAELSLLEKEKQVSVTSLLLDKKIEVWGDEHKLRMVTSNLIKNAIIYNKLNGKVEVSLEETDTEIRLCVSDTGIGMSEQDLEKIFDKLYRVEMRAKNKDKVWGMGLVTVKEIVQMHCGKISVESQVEKGSKFIVTLPKSLRVTERGVVCDDERDQGIAP